MYRQSFHGKKEIGHLRVAVIIELGSTTWRVIFWGHEAIYI
jgi:hypothetical protein